MSKLFDVVRGLLGLETSAARVDRLHAQEEREFDAAMDYMREQSEGREEAAQDEARLEAMFERNALERGMAIWEDEGIAREEAKLRSETPSLADAVPVAGTNLEDVMQQVIEQRERYAQENGLTSEDLIDLRRLLAEELGDGDRLVPEPEKREIEQEMER